MSVRWHKAWMLTLIIPLLFIERASAMSVEEKFTMLRTLYENDLGYSEELPVDTVIKWGEEIESLMEKQDRLREQYGVKHMMVRAYCVRRDIGLALDKVRLMYRKVQENNNLFGTGVTYMAAGDVYAHSNMQMESIKSYKKAKAAFDIIEEEGICMKILLLELAHVLLQVGENEEAGIYLKELESLMSGDEDPTYFTYLYHKAYYNTVVGNLNRAENQLDKVKQIIGSKNMGSVRKTSLSFVFGKHFEKKGEYGKALKALDNIDTEIVKRLDPIRYTELTFEKSRLLERVGRTEEACLLFQQMNGLKDSLNIKSYVRQVNELRADYQVSLMERENRAQKNQLLQSILAFVTILLTVGIILMIYFRRSNLQIKATKQQLKEAKEYAEKSVQSKSLFLSNMSHEIRTPLNALTGFSAILTEDYVDKETRRQCNDIIQQNSRLLLKLIDDVIDLSSMEFGKMQFSFKECDVMVVCRNVVDMVEKVKQTQAGVIFQTEFEECVLCTDEARLQQVLINLLINATKFTLSGMITLELKPADDKDFVLFTVTDTGCGIPLEKQANIFDRFEKVDEAKQGTGLGLSICELIVNHIGGEIWIDSSYTEGTRFCFTHPIHQPTSKL